MPTGAISSGPGGEAPRAPLPRLDTSPFPESDLDRGLQDEAIRAGGYERESQFVARLQPFSPGGFEGTCYWRSKDADRHNPLGIIRDFPRPRAAADVAADKAHRARKRVRHLAREIAADHLITLTTREATNDPYELLGRFEKFVELYRKAMAGKQFLYVAVPEPHPSNPGHWHVHFATRGKLHVNVARGIWWALCGGRGMGNVDARFIRCRAGLDRALKVARYISKYISKSFESGGDLGGRHRYRASRITLGARRMLVLAARSVHEAVDALLAALDLTRGDLSIFIFPDWSGFWFSCNGDLSEQLDKPPPF